MSKDTHTYTNDHITVIWKPALCIHSKKCWQELGEVFNPRERPWIKIEGAPYDRIMQQVKACPSGALSYELHTPAQKLHTEHAAVQPAPGMFIECLPDGPILVKGDVVVKKSDGTEEIKAGTIALCRCGASANKPYCDGSHRGVGFKG